MPYQTFKKYIENNVGRENKQLLAIARRTIQRSPSPPYSIKKFDDIRATQEKEFVGLVFNRQVTQTLKSKWDVVDGFQTKLREDVARINDHVTAQHARYELAVQQGVKDRISNFDITSKIEKLGTVAITYGNYKNELEEVIDYLKPYNDFIEEVCKHMNMTKNVDLLNRFKTLTLFKQSLVKDFSEKHVELETEHQRLKEVKDKFEQVYVESNTVMGSLISYYEKLVKDNKTMERDMEDYLKTASSQFLAQYRKFNAINSIYEKVQQQKGLGMETSDPIEMLNAVEGRMINMNDVVKDLNAAWKSQLPNKQDENKGKKRSTIFQDHSSPQKRRTVGKSAKVSARAELERLKLGGSSSRKLTMAEASLGKENNKTGGLLTPGTTKKGAKSPAISKTASQEGSSTATTASKNSRKGSRVKVSSKKTNAPNTNNSRLSPNDGKYDYNLNHEVSGSCSNEELTNEQLDITESIPGDVICEVKSEDVSELQRNWCDLQSSWTDKYLDNDVCADERYFNNPDMDVSDILKSQYNKINADQKISKSLKDELSRHEDMDQNDHASKDKISFNSKVTENSVELSENSSAKTDDDKIDLHVGNNSCHDPLPRIDSNEDMNRLYTDFANSNNDPTKTKTKTVRFYDNETQTQSNAKPSTLTNFNQQQKQHRRQQQQRKQLQPVLKQNQPKHDQRQQPQRIPQQLKQQQSTQQLPPLKQQRRKVSPLETKAKTQRRNDNDSNAGQSSQQEKEVLCVNTRAPPPTVQNETNTTVHSETDRISRRIKMIPVKTNNRTTQLVSVTRTQEQADKLVSGSMADMVIRTGNVKYHQDNRRIWRI